MNFPRFFFANFMDFSIFPSFPSKNGRLGLRRVLKMLPRSVGKICPGYGGKRSHGGMILTIFDNSMTFSVDEPLVWSLQMSP